MIGSILRVAVSAIGVTACAAAQTTIDPANKHAYGANIGWIDLAGNNSDGVVVGESFLSGFAYGANVGWISFGDGSPDSGTAYSNTSASDYGVNHSGTGNLSGFAYGANIGWISFDWIDVGWAGIDRGNRPRVDLVTGEFRGFAYGSNVGWINLGAGYLATSSLACPDDDADGISDPWELEYFGDTTTANGSSDQDGDGVSDKNEYLGGSDPTDPDSYLRIVSQSNALESPTTRSVEIEFTTSPSRLYQVLVSSDLKTFVDSGHGTFSPDAGATTSKTLLVGTGTRFFRVMAVKPLQ